MSKINILISNLDKIHTTKLGINRIKKNLDLECEDVVEWCKQNLSKENCQINRQGKNWYATIDNIQFTINAYSYTIITAHKLKKEKVIVKAEEI